MKKALKWGAIIFGAIIVIAGCTASNQTSSRSDTPKPQSPPKPTETGARAFAKKWVELARAGKYAELYELLSPDDKKLVSKKTYIETSKKNKEEASTIDYKVTIGTIEMGENTAKVTRSVATPLGNISDIDEIVFMDGKWYQKLEAESLLDFGVSPTKINGIKREALGQQFSIPAFSANITNARTDKTATSEYGSRETAKGKFVMVDVSIVNTGKQPFRPSESEYFKLIDSQGRSFNPSDSYMVFSSFDEIAPGLSETKTIGFDVPEDAKGLILIVGKGSELRFVELGV